MIGQRPFPMRGVIRGVSKELPIPTLNDCYRNALDPARSTLGLPVVAFMDYPLQTNVLIKAVHIMQLREGVE